ncbi:MAG: hypothetical protein ACW960_05945 [Candidatus Thorarchaeota archaeon]|jgi:hypothetical protein
MQFYYEIIMWVLLVGATITLMEAMVLLLLFRNEVWWETRINRIVLSLDIITGLGWIIATIVYLVGSIEVIYTTSFAAFMILMVMVFSHLWRLNQYLFKTGEKFVKNTSMFVMNVIKIVLLMGGALLGSGVTYPIVFP